MPLEGVKLLSIDKYKWFQISNYKPHPAQLEVHSSKARFRVLVAGRRWGKTLLAAKEAEVEIIKPNTRGWIVSNTYELGEKVFRVIYNDMIIKFGLETKRRSYSPKSGSMYIEFEWGSVVEVKSADHPDSLVGEGLDWLIFDECASCKSIVWEQYLRPTLTDRLGWAIFISTPRGYNWFYELYKRGKDPNYPDWDSWQFPTSTNIYIKPEEIEEARRTLSKQTFAQEYEAQFTTNAGQVYSDFSEELHVVNEQEFPDVRNMKRFRAIDFGYENPFVCLYIAVDEDDRVWIYDEYYSRHKSLEAHCYELNRGTRIGEQTIKVPCNKKYNKDVITVVDPKCYVFTVCDVSAKGARMTLLEHGIETIASKSDVIRGIELIRKQLMVRPDGKPGLLVSSKCINTIREFNLYSYDTDNNNEEPKKENDHAMDALRYFMIQWSQGEPVQKAGKY